MKNLPHALTAVLLTATACAQDPHFGLVAYWPMEALANADTEMPDTANGNNLSLVNMGAGSVVPGRIGNAVSFNGVDQMLVRDFNVTPSTGLPLTNGTQRTICLWVKGIGTGQNDKRIFSESSTSSNAPLYNLNTANNGNNGTLDVFIRTENNTVRANHLRTNTSPLDGNWHHVGVTDANGAMNIYIDGVFDRTVTYTNTAFNANILSLGALRRATDGSFFNGQLDEVAVWNRTLTAAEIASVAANGVPSFALPAISVSPAGPYQQGDRVVISGQGFAQGGAVTFQWRKGGLDLPGETNSTLTIAELNAGNSGVYDVLVNGTPTATVTLSFTADPAANLGQNLVSWWPGETINTADVPPSSPDPWGGNPLGCENMTELDLASGQFGKAFVFDGVGKLARRTTGFAISTNPEFTVAFWAKADGTVQNDLRAFAESSTTSDIPLFTLGTSSNATTSLRAYVRNNANQGLAAVLSTRPVFDNTWHHVAWSEKNGRVRCYIDGVMDGANFDINRTGSVFTFDRTTLGGIQRAVNSHWLNGMIDDTAVWNRALTWTEVQALVATGVPAPIVPVPPSITAQPAPTQSGYEGRGMQLSIQAVGSPELTYQWYKGVDPVAGATEATFTLASALPADSGSYTCRVTNSVATVASDPGVLVVHAITPLVTGKVSLWPMETAGATTPDVLSGFDFTLTNMDAFSFQPGRVGRGVLFDGVDDILVHNRSGAGGDAAISQSKEYSISFWVRGNGIGQADRRIFSEASTLSNNPLYNLGTDATGATPSLSIYIRSDSGSVLVDHLNTFSPVLDDQWHHVVVSDLDGQLQVYVDGQPDVGVSYPRRASTMNTVSAGGIARSSLSHQFTGLVDQLCLWDRAITAGEAFLLHAIDTGAALSISNFEILPGNQLRIHFSTLLGTQTYRVETTDDLTAGPWSVVPGATVTPLTSESYKAEFTSPGSGRKFFRIATL